MLGGGADENDENVPCDGLSGGGWEYCYSLQSWKAEKYSSVQEYQTEVKSIYNEEVFHMLTHSLAKVFPKQIGDEDFTSSVSCREMARL